MDIGKCYEMEKRPEFAWNNKIVSFSGIKNIPRLFRSALKSKYSRRADALEVSYFS